MVSKPSVDRLISTLTEEHANEKRSAGNGAPATSGETGALSNYPLDHVAAGAWIAGGCPDARRGAEKQAQGMVLRGISGLGALSNYPFPYPATAFIATI